MFRVHSPAKINLHLAVGAPLPDGYHELTSVFHALELADEVIVVPADRLSLQCDADLGVSAEHNLAYRAAQAMGDAFGRDPSVAITIRKRIPHGAGLGGGSSNAAAVIAALAKLWGVDTGGAASQRVARDLGADVAFFLVPGGAALMSGRGDRVERELTAFAGVDLVLVRPPLPVSTAQAYATFDREPVPTESPEAVLRALEERDVRALGNATFNNLGNASISVVPLVGEVLGWVRCQTGVVGAQVSGSGSAVFAICESAADGRAVVKAAEDRGWWAVVSRLGSTGVRVRDEE